MANREVLRPQNRNGAGFSRTLGRIFLQQKLNNWQGYVLIGLTAIFFGYLMAKVIVAGIGLLAFALGLFTIIVCISSPLAGLCFAVIYSFNACEFSRMFFDGSLQVGVFWDVLLMASLLGVFARVHNLGKTTATFFQSRVVIWSVLFTVYFFLELFNPLGHSVEGWYAGFRKFVENLVCLYIAYQVLSSYAAVKKFSAVLFVGAALAGAYGCYQQWFGLPEYDRIWATEDPTRYGLFFIMNNFRKFSTLPDPTCYGMLMAFTAVYFTLIGLNEKRRWVQVILFGGVLAMIMGMTYSGTRTSNVMLLAAIALYVMLTFQKKSTRRFAIFSVLLLVVLIRLPIYSNQTLNRFRSSFEGQKDASYALRDVERKHTQPYIYTHPVGGGIATTGNIGLKLNPGHDLAGYQTDDGYLKFALETGYIGLIILCILNFFILRACVRAYFRAKDPRYKALFAGCFAALFSFVLAALAQEVSGQVPCDAVYYSVLGIVLRLGMQQGSPEKEVVPGPLPATS
jgi:putative inorganic carbon (HCO3(-)) transporter